jgi:hypothetical protein
MRRPWLWFLIGIGLSAAVTAALWFFKVPGFGLFLLFPFMFWPSLGREGEHTTRYGECPTCGWVPTDADARFCPKDGTKLA